jgi:hypothetical protein
MNWLKKIAPWISAAATGNVPALVGMAAQAVGGALGKEVKPSVDAIAAAVAGATPEQLIALKNADHDFELKSKALGFETVEQLLQIDASDRKDARAREVALKDRIPAILAIGVTFGFFGLLFFLLRHSPPADSKDVLNIMLGSLGTAWVSIVAYYFGSSAGSAAKNEMLANK